MKIDPKTGRLLRLTDLERFSHYDIAGNGCWNWIGSIRKNGYGNARYDGKNISAHRMAAHLFLGLPLGDKRQVLHHCDNPRCVNPAHLFLGTQSDNLKDCVAKGRHPKTQKTHCPKGHPYGGENLGSWGGGRRCRICSRNAANLYYSKKTGRGRAKAFLQEHLGRFHEA
jgi:HNH endonuclease